MRKPKIGEIWEMRPPTGSWLARIEGDSKIERDWIKVREVGGARHRGSYPLNAFRHARLVAESEEE